MGDAVKRTNTAQALREQAEWLDREGVLLDAPTPEKRAIPFLMVEGAQEIERLRAALMRVHEQSLEFDKTPNLHGTNATDTEKGWFEGHALAWSQVDEIVAPVLFNPGASS